MTSFVSVNAIFGLFNKYNRLFQRTHNLTLHFERQFFKPVRFYRVIYAEKFSYGIVVKRTGQSINLGFSHWFSGHSHLFSTNNNLIDREITLRKSFFSTKSGNDRDEKFRNRTTLNYVLAIIVLSGALAFAFVPFYQIFCQVMGLGGQATRGHDTSVVETMKPIKSRPLVIKFDSNVNSTMRWEFYPLQSKMTVYPGETALAFYKAKNPTNKPIVGIATYNILPFTAAVHFNKIQCFCFEEQMLQPHEEVDMPVFFYIDPEFDNDHNMELVTELSLYYTFFEAKPGLKLPQPGELWPKH